MRLYDHAHIAHRIDHLSPYIMVGIRGTDREVATLVPWLISQVGFFVPRGIPRTFDRVDLVVATMLILLVANIIENEEFGLRADIADVRDARTLHVPNRLACYVTRIAGVVLPSDRVYDIRKHADRGTRVERVHSGC